MQANLLLGPIPIPISSSSSAIGFYSSLIADSLRRTYSCNRYSKSTNPLPRSTPIVASSSTTIDGDRNHYQVLGVPRAASSKEIKKAFRLLARKYHPDVSKDLRAADAFKSIRHAYEVLANEATRAQYDQALKLQESTERRYRGKWYYSPDFEERSRSYRWAELKQKRQYERDQKYYRFQEDFSRIDEDEEEEEEEEEGEEEGGSSELRSPFVEVLKTTFLSLFLLQTFGSQLSLTFSGLVALFDWKLDAGYKMGHLVAWLLGGRAGVLLAICLSFASWVCGKSSSSVVAVVVVAMWVGSNLARYAPLPQGAVLTLLYMSIKLQADFN
ncbi:dnaJ-3, partial [Cucurbita argyrosperma subsp. argyrosperma]